MKLKLMGIARAGVLILSDEAGNDLRSHIDNTRALGKNSFWTDTALYL